MSNGIDKIWAADLVEMQKFSKWNKGTEEIFVTDKVLPTKPVTYSIVDLMGEDIKGSFYEQELQKAKQQTFRIEKVIKRDKKKKDGISKMEWIS